MNILNFRISFYLHFSREVGSMRRNSSLVLLLVFFHMVEDIYSEKKIFKRKLTKGKSVSVGINIISFLNTSYLL